MSQETARRDSPKELAIAALARQLSERTGAHQDDAAYALRRMVDAGMLVLEPANG